LRSAIFSQLVLRLRTSPKSNVRNFAKRIFPAFALALLTVSLPAWATAPGVTSQVWISSLTMQSMSSKNFMVQASPVGGVSVAAGAPGSHATVVSGLPSGVSASWSAPTVTQYDAVQWTLTLTGSINAVASAGNLNLSLTLQDSKSGLLYSTQLAMPLTVTLTSATLNYSTALTHFPVKQGQTSNQVFSFTTGGSFQGSVSLAITGMPSFVKATWSANPVTISAGQGTTTLTLAPSSTATVNWFQFTVTATGDGVTVAKLYTVEVEPIVGMQAVLSHPALTIEPSTSATLSVTAQPMNGVQIPTGATGATASIVSGLPSGVTASWSKPAVNSAGAAAWSLQLTAGSSVATGNYPMVLALQITDSSSGISYATNVNFSVLVSLLASVTVNETPGLTIPSTFMGMSHEWGVAQFYMSDASRGVNTIYRQLLANLSSYGAGPINLRIGGNSTDSSTLPTSTTIPPLAELATATGVKFELGVNLGSNNVALAKQQATAYASQMPAGSIQAIEIGNEPDWYAINGLRPASYTFQDYFNDFYTWKQQVLPVLPTGIKLMGASWAVTPTLTNMQPFVSGYSKNISVFSQHFYATSVDDDPVIDYLLEPATSTKGAQQVASSVAIAHANGFPFRIGETGAIAGGGIQDISDAFGASLWSIDTMFEYANVGVDGVNW
jgi:hypothetical protein